VEKLTYTEAEFCRRVGISRTTAWNLRRKGKLQHCRVGAKILYTQQHLEDFISAHQRPLPDFKRYSSKRQNTNAGV
jgi:predicted site-specific integrase-resolvase